VAALDLAQEGLPDAYGTRRVGLFRASLPPQCGEGSPEGEVVIV
jgi:hypothetical protein